MRQIDLISITNSVHYLLFGLDDNEMSNFSIQLWITKYGVRMTDWVQSMGLNFLSFMGGDLWVHNDETVDRCKLFGEKRDCIVGVISNEEPLKIKLYDSLEIDSTDEWEITSITIPATLNYPSGMISKLPKERFKKRDGVLRAEFLRNMITTSDTPSIIDAINGEALRGRTAYLTLKNTSNDQVKLFKVALNLTKSKV
jgi:hypothetical protein